MVRARGLSWLIINSSSTTSDIHQGLLLLPHSTTIMGNPPPQRELEFLECSGNFYPLTLCF